MADKRAFAKFDVGYLDNPKMADLLDEYPAAILMHMAGILYCAQHLTDGLISPAAMQRKVGGSRDETKALISAGLWHEPGHNCVACPDVPEGKAYVHDFLEHNRSATEAKRVAEKAAGAAKARWTKDDAPSMHRASPTHARKHAHEDAQSDASGMPREREREKEKNTSSSPAKPSMEFDSFWAQYPRKVGKQAAIKAYTKALKLTTPETILKGVKALRTETREPQFIPHPSTWLNEGRWDDEPTETVKSGGFDPKNWMNQ